MAYAFLECMCLFSIMEKRLFYFIRIVKYSFKRKFFPIFICNFVMPFGVVALVMLQWVASPTKQGGRIFLSYRN